MFYCGFEKLLFGHVYRPQWMGGELFVCMILLLGCLLFHPASVRSSGSVCYSILQHVKQYAITCGKGSS